jgi:hypothetical protein
MTTKAEALEAAQFLISALKAFAPDCGYEEAANKTTDFINSVPEWQDMSSAPRDGTIVLVLLPRMQNLIIRARYSIHKYWETDDERPGLTRPTFFHEGDLWQPLPTPPITGVTP